MLLSVFILAMPLMALPYGYMHIYLGGSPEYVNKKLLQSNMIKEEVSEETVEIYAHGYADPLLVWRNEAKNAWVHFSFTTHGNLTNVIEADNSVLHLTYDNREDFTQLVYKKGNVLPEGNNWVYRFFFYKDRLIAISLRYENTEESKTDENEERFKKGYKMDAFVFKANEGAFYANHGGADRKFGRNYDEFSRLHYEAYFSEGRVIPIDKSGTPKVLNSAMVKYYHEYFGRIANYTVSYVDNDVISEVYRKMQNDLYFVTAVENDTITF